jgi:hypothetical protein
MSTIFDWAIRTSQNYTLGVVRHKLEEKAFEFGYFVEERASIIIVDELIKKV